MPAPLPFRVELGEGRRHIDQSQRELGSDVQRTCRRSEIEREQRSSPLVIDDLAFQAEGVVDRGVKGYPRLTPSRAIQGDPAGPGGRAVVVLLELAHGLSAGDVRTTLFVFDHAVLDAVRQVEVVGERPAGREEPSIDSHADLGEGRRHDLRRYERPVDEVPARAIVVLVEITDGRKQNLRAYGEGRAQLQVDQGGLERDLLGAVLEFQL